VRSFGHLFEKLRPWHVLAVIAALGATALLGGKYLVASTDARAATDPQASEDRPASGNADVRSSVDLTEKQASTLTIAPAPVQEFAVRRTAVGTIDFNQNMLIQVFSQYQGKIIRAFYNTGDDVKQGDLLFTIDSPDLLEAESSLLASAGVLELQTRTLSRATQLLKAGGSAQKDIDQATSDRQTAEANFRAAKNAVRIFGKTDAEIEQILESRHVDSTLLVSSPITGRIITRNAAPGLLTQPGNAPAPFSVADISTMWMVANVIETDAPAYKVGQEVEVRVPAYPDAVFKGHVTVVGSMIDPTTHRQLVRSEIADPEHLLRPGMFASFVIQTGDPVRSVAVPADAVVREGDGTMTVWVTSDRRHFSKRIVKVGLQQQSGQSQILEGLTQGELVVTEGAVFLSNKLLLGANG